MGGLSERCPECGGKRGEGYEVHGPDCSKMPHSSAALSNLGDHELAEKLRDSLKPRVAEARGLELDNDNGTRDEG